MDLSVLLAFTAAALVISVVPGPDMMFVVANGIARGRRAGLVAALGMSTGLAVHTVAAALGLGTLLHAAPAVLDAVRIVGAAFLVYLAVTTLRSRTRIDDRPVDQATGHRSLRRTYLMAVLTNLANPKVILFFLAFFPQFLVADGGWPAWVQFLVLGAVFIAVGLTVDGTVGLAAGTLSALLLRRPSVQRWLDRISAAIFGALAVRLVADQTGH
ncbi:LysE family translocator [Prauserella shujinwangii]|uniref:LysE family translocator n=1 Tax=Prauserella shujinwangii TaxID=1453103 RepID=UPI000D0751C2|nr:LysE family translocator [Prauserella shujinwangii]